MTVPRRYWRLVDMDVEPDEIGAPDEPTLARPFPRDPFDLDENEVGRSTIWDALAEARQDRGFL